MINLVIFSLFILWLPTPSKVVQTKILSLDWSMRVIKVYYFDIFLSIPDLVFRFQCEALTLSRIICRVGPTKSLYRLLHRELHYEKLSKK